MEMLMELSIFLMQFTLLYKNDLGHARTTQN